MLHPDSHNMFENGSFLRRRRRFKQEGANGNNRNQQQNGSTSGGGRRNQLQQRNSPNLISPTSTNGATSTTNAHVDPRPNGTKSSRSRHQAMNSMGKDSLNDDTDCLESPRKVCLDC